MLVKKVWIQKVYRNKYHLHKIIHWEGLYLFGFIPLWKEQVKVEYKM